MIQNIPWFSFWKLHLPGYGEWKSHLNNPETKASSVINYKPPIGTYSLDATRNLMHEDYERDQLGLWMRTTDQYEARKLSIKRARHLQWHKLSVRMRGCDGQDAYLSSYRIVGDNKLTLQRSNTLALYSNDSLF